MQCKPEVLTHCWHTCLTLSLSPVGSIAEIVPDEATACIDDGSDPARAHPPLQLPHFRTHRPIDRLSASLCVAVSVIEQAAHALEKALKRYAACRKDETDKVVGSPS